MKLSIHSPGVVISATVEPDHIFIICIRADNPGHGDGSRAIEVIKRLGKPIWLISKADFPELQDNLDRFYFRHGFVRSGRYMEWRPE